ncbi:golgin subfamily A member 6-like protein 22 [Pipra filicauda]|uniref:Golgin subfamily A member 6-like protein 22 n=1 Tax=Pipra filicauda TaxID=649802 RepID=A0A7R5KZH9_9PASS|nr:golgin subfamily A member 6-like protein 22 [Pipra filicauda]
MLELQALQKRLEELQELSKGLEENRLEPGAELIQRVAHWRRVEDHLHLQKDRMAALQEVQRLQKSLRDQQEEQIHHLEMERRRLHNDTQEPKDNIPVFCRVRPVLPEESERQRGLQHLHFSPQNSTTLIVTQPDEVPRRRHRLQLHQERMWELREKLRQAQKRLRKVQREKRSLEQKNQRLQESREQLKESTETLHQELRERERRESTLSSRVRTSFQQVSWRSTTNPCGICCCGEGSAEQTSKSDGSAPTVTSSTYPTSPGCQSPGRRRWENAEFLGFEEVWEFWGGNWRLLG